MPWLEARNGAGLQPPQTRINPGPAPLPRCGSGGHRQQRRAGVLESGLVAAFADHPDPPGPMPSSLTSLLAATDIPGHMLVIALLLAAICTGFIFRFVLPALGLGRLFRRTIGQLEQLRESGGNPDPQQIGRDIMGAPPLAHLWREYAQTLHPTRTEAGPRWRATALAESFLTEQALVDTPLRAEFYKHLPGILTGIGILGTFSGLIVGLTHFEVSASADVVRGSLRELIQGVGHAFKISAIAIGLAMLLTWVEKSLVVARYRQVERLNQLIDSLFDTGIGEEYLARLVGASEGAAQQAAQQAAQLRQALVAEMRQAMASLLEQQQQAGQRQLENMTAGLAGAVGDSIRAPLERLTQTLERMEAQQGKAVAGGISQALDGLLGNVGQQIGEQLGRQEREAEQRQDRLLQSLEATGQRFEASSQRLEKAIQESMAQLAGQLAQQVAGVSEAIGGGQQAQQERLTEQTDKLMGKVAGHLQGVTTELKNAAATLEGCVASFNRAGSQAMGQLSAGAEAVQLACGGFAAAGRSFDHTAQTVAEAGRAIQSAAGSLAAASAGNGQLLEQQHKVGASLRELLQEVQGTVALAQREAALNSEVVGRLESAAQSLARAEQRADVYLQGVSEVLAKAHGAFADNVERSLKAGNAQFQRELAEAVGYLKDAIEHLGDVLADGKG